MDPLPSERLTEFFASFFVYIFGVQAAVHLLLAGVLYQWHRRRFEGSKELIYWSLSWCFLGIYHLAAGLALYFVAGGYSSENWQRITASWIAQVSGYAQPFFLYLGLQVAIHPQRARKRTLVVMLGTIFLAATALIVWTHQPGFDSTTRFALKLVPRALICAVVYTLLTVQIIRHKLTGSGAERWLFPIGMLLYGVSQLFKSWQYMFHQGASTFQVSIYMQVADLLFQVIAGVGMLVWFLGVAHRRTVAVGKKLEDSREQLERAQRAGTIGRLVGGIAHDFNNLLTVIQGHAAIARENQDRPEHHGASLQQITAASRSAAELVGQLLDFSKRQRGTGETYAVAKLIRELKGMLPRVIDATIKLEWPSVSVKNYVHLDRTQLEMVILNLVINAQEALPDGGTIRIDSIVIELSREKARELKVEAGEYVTVKVEDDGIGIDEETCERVFDRFFTTKKTGTGLGLFTSREFVRENNGALTVESSPGKGSVFTIYLPTTSVRNKQISEQPKVNENGTGTVLIVEDDEATLEVAIRILEDVGFEVLWANNGQNALLEYNTYVGKLDLLIADVVMPEMGGRELAETLTSRQESLQVLFISGYSPEKLGSVAIDRHRWNRLNKPFSPEQLITAVREQLNRRLDLTS